MGVVHNQGSLGEWPWPTRPNTWVNDLGEEIVRDPLQIPFAEDSITPYISGKLKQLLDRLPPNHPHRRDGFTITGMRVYPRSCSLDLQFFGSACTRATHPRAGWHMLWVRRWSIDEKDEKRLVRSQGPDPGAALPVVTPRGKVVTRTLLKGPADLRRRIEMALVVLDDLATKGIPGAGDAAVPLHRGWTSVCFRQTLRQFFRAWALLGEGHRGPMFTAPLTEALTGIRPETPGEENELLYPWMVLAPWPPSATIIDQNLWKKWKSAGKFDQREQRETEAHEAEPQDNSWETP